VEVLFGLWALEWAWLHGSTNLRCVYVYVCIISTSTFHISWDTDVLTDGRMDRAKSTWVLIGIRNIYTLYGRTRFLLDVTFVPTNLVYPLPLRSFTCFFIDNLRFISFIGLCLSCKSFEEWRFLNDRFLGRLNFWVRITFYLQETLQKNIEQYIVLRVWDETQGGIKEVLLDRTQPPDTTHPKRVFCISGNTDIKRICPMHRRS